MFNRTSNDTMQLISVYTIITIVVFLNSNKTNNNICFQFILKYILSSYKTKVIDIFFAKTKRAFLSGAGLDFTFEVIK